MDEDERVTHGPFATAEEAIAACKKIVEENLIPAFNPGMTAAELCSGYTSFGDDPFVVGPSGAPIVSFSAWDYAKARAEELCASSATRG